MQTKKMALYYGVWAAVLLIVEICIGSVWKDVYFIRAYAGDVLVIPLIYCLIRIFVKIWPKIMPLAVCCIGFLAEFLQYIRLSDRLGFERGSLPAIIIGTSFSWWDVLCYIVGMALIYGGMYLRGALMRRES